MEQGRVVVTDGHCGSRFEFGTREKDVHPNCRFSW